MKKKITYESDGESEIVNAITCMIRLVVVESFWSLDPKHKL